MDRLLDAATAAEFKGGIAQLQADVHDFLHTDVYACWTVNRPVGWADSASVESQGQIGVGTGKLYEQGAGGPQSGEQVIHVESPYRFRTLTTSPIDTGHLLVVNGQRLFRVDVVKRESDDDRLMNGYLTELFNTPMPGRA